MVSLNLTPVTMLPDHENYSFINMKNASFLGTLTYISIISYIYMIFYLLPWLDASRASSQQLSYGWPAARLTDGRRRLAAYCLALRPKALADQA